MERHLRTGCFVHLAWIDKWGELSNPLASQHDFEQTRGANPQSHELARDQRSKAQTYWSNYTKRIQLQAPHPAEQLATLMLEEAKARYSRLLLEFGNTHLSELILDIEL